MPATILAAYSGNIAEDSQKIGRFSLSVLASNRALRRSARIS
jgi:hypothetical protein